LAKSATATTTDQVLKARTLSDELQRLYTKATKMVAGVDATRTKVPTSGADNVKIVRENHQVQGNQTQEFWTAKFPSDHASCTREELRGWFLRSLLKNAAMRVGSGVTFDSIKTIEAKYYQVRGSVSPTKMD
jgi:hypothetical protein